MLHNGTGSSGYAQSRIPGRRQGGASLTRTIAVALSGEYMLLNCEEGLASRVLHCEEALGY